MRLGIYLPPPDRRPAGVGVYIEGIVPRVAAAVEECTLFVGDNGVQPAWLDGLDVVPRPLIPGLPARLTRLLDLQLWLRREAVRRRLDVLFVPFHDGIYRSPVPQVVVVHDLTSLRQPRSFRAGVRLYARLVLRPVLARTAGVVAISASTRRDLHELWQIDPAKIEVIYEGFDRQVFRPYPRGEIEEALEAHGVRSPYVLYAGTAARHKNLGLLLEVFDRARRQVPDLVLAVTGRRDVGEYEAFERAVAGRGLAEAVRHLGYVGRGDLARLMSGTSAFVFPSLAEGFGLAPLEAMACGALVIAADRASLPEVVGEGGLLLDPEDVGDWTRAVVDAAREPGGHRQPALAQAARFDWRDAAERIVELLRRIAEAGDR